jgi:hypothetical protein
VARRACLAEAAQQRRQVRGDSLRRSVYRPPLLDFSLINIKPQTSAGASFDFPVINIKPQPDAGDATLGNDSARKVGTAEREHERSLCIANRNIARYLQNAIGKRRQLFRPSRALADARQKDQRVEGSTSPT